MIKCVPQNDLASSQCCLGAVFLVASVFSSVPEHAVAQQGLQVFTAPEGQAAEQAEQPKKKKINKLSLALQQELNRLGCKAGAADGIWGNGSEAAMNRLASAKPNLKNRKHSQSLLNEMRSLPKGTCSAVVTAGSKPITPAVAGGFDGSYIMAVTQGGNCNYSGSTGVDAQIPFSISGNQISSNEKAGFKGKVSSSGKISIWSKNNFGYVVSFKGKVKGKSGSGKFSMTGWPCRGTFTLRRT